MATECVSNKIDSNLTGLAYAEEVCLKQLPTLADDGADPVWFNLEPNSYSDMGGELSTVARNPIDPSRQNKKGAVVDLDASGGFNIDFTKTNLLRLLQGFFFADIRQKPSTKLLNSARVVISSVSGTQYNAAAGLLPFNVPGLLLFVSGFGVSMNNGIKVAVAATATELNISGSIAAEASPPPNAAIEAVGFEFPADDVDIAVVGNIPSLISTATDLRTLGLIPGEWIFIGGDMAGQRFADNVGFARINTISENAIVFDDVSFVAQNEAGTGKTVRIFFGSVLKNENVPSLIKRRSYNIERQLSNGPTGPQAEYLEGAVANEFTLNVPQADKLNADLAFVACDNTFRSGEVDDEIKEGTRVAAPNEDAYNTSSDIARIKMHVIDPTAANPAALFGYVSEASVAINNDVSPNKAVGVLGAFDTSAGNFNVSGSVTAYFSTVAAVKAVRGNADVGMSIIGASKNAGFVFDIPLLALGGGRINVEKDQPITVPLEPSGAQNKHGFTLLYGMFPYLPNQAMPK